MEILKPICILLVIICCYSTDIYGRQIKLDHVISVFAGLDDAVDHYSQLGFTIKKGSIHSNGLINAHIKFSNQSYYELMSLSGEPGDDTAKEYQKLIDEGDGGVYVALSGIDTEEMDELLSKLGIGHETFKGMNWNYITFDNEPELAHFFFIDYHKKVYSSDQTINHRNQSVEIIETHVEGTERLAHLLSGIGLPSSMKESDVLSGKIARFKTKTGDIVIVQKKETSERPRIKSISFGKIDGTGTIRIDF